MADINNSAPLFLLAGQSWSKANHFSVELYPTLAELRMEMPDFNAAILNVAIPDVSDETVAEWLGSDWKYSPGRLSPPELSITFKDTYNNSLYNYFKAHLVEQRKGYFADILFGIKVYSIDLGSMGSQELKISGEGLLTGVSGITFDQSTDQILEFSCTWKLKNMY